MAVAALVIGLFMITTILQDFRVIGTNGVTLFPLAVIGLILGILAVTKKSRRGIAIGGIVLNVLAVAYGASIMILARLGG